MTEDPAGEWARMRGISPRRYICRRALSAITIDGDIDKPVWNNALWTDDFIDIEGASKPAPRFRTRAKMLWDDEFLYAGAEMVEPHVVATITQKNSVIFHDNDFEIFIDPDGDNHNYYEFEMNAFNTIWELTLPKPYKDRSEPKLGTNLAGLKSAVRVRGTINDPTDKDEGWSVEVALPWKGLAEYNRGRATPPRDGDVWRINFSRVEWIYDVVDGRYVRRPREKIPEDNWVWSPQGIVDMHRPERWGMLLFTTAPIAKDVAFPRATVDTAIEQRDQLMEVYYRQRVFHAAHGHFADGLAELSIDSTCVSMETNNDGFIATVTWTDDDKAAQRLHVNNDARIWSD